MLFLLKYISLQRFYYFSKICFGDFMNCRIILILFCDCERLLQNTKSPENLLQFTHYHKNKSIALHEIFIIWPLFIVWSTESIDKIISDKFASSLKEYEMQKQTSIGLFECELINNELSPGLG